MGKGMDGRDLKWQSVLFKMGGNMGQENSPGGDTLSTSYPEVYGVEKKGKPPEEKAVRKQCPPR